MEGVYALGDVTGRVELTPMAIAAGRRLSDRLFGGMKDAKVSSVLSVALRCSCSYFFPCSFVL